MENVQALVVGGKGRLGLILWLLGMFGLERGDDGSRWGEAAGRHGGKVKVAGENEIGWFRASERRPFCFAELNFAEEAKSSQSRVESSQVVREPSGTGSAPDRGSLAIEIFRPSPSLPPPCSPNLLGNFQLPHCFDDCQAYCRRRRVLRSSFYSGQCIGMI